MADSTSTAYDLVTDPPAESRGSPAAVELAGVAHRLGHRWALRGLTLRVEPGEVVALIGANGSGKTTLLRILATALVPTRGSALVFGHDLRAEPEPARAVTAMLGHATGLYDDLTAVENLRFAQEMCGAGWSTAGIEAALDTVGMRDHGRTMVRTLSSGMRRRIALARLILRRARLLLLDEPYNSFDEVGAALVDSLVRDTASLGGAAVVATHDLARSGGMRFDRVVALSAGRVIELASSGRK